MMEFDMAGRSLTAGHEGNTGRNFISNPFVENAMASDVGDSNYWAALTGIGGLVIGAVGTALGHLFNSRASMAALVDARIRILIDGYERRIADLQDEIGRLEGKVDGLTTTLEEERARTGPARQSELRLG
ncbi:MAG TPA: hypothetical protein VLZ74_02610 [Methylocella sp.]|nr:hypothetical protein [Methylocella sp.]